MYVGVSHCSSTAIKMDEVTIAGGVCLTNDTSSKAGELLFLLYRLTGASCKIKTQMLYISRGNFSSNSQSSESRIPSIHISTQRSFPTSLFINMTDITLSRNMGSALCIKNVRFPVFLQSVFVSGNLNGAVEIYHSTVTFIGTTLNKKINVILLGCSCT